MNKKDQLLELYKGENIIIVFIKPKQHDLRKDPNDLLEKIVNTGVNKNDI